MGENSDPAKAKGALGQVQVGFLEYIPRRGVLQVEIAAQEEVSVGVVRRRGGERTQGRVAIVRGCIKGSNSETKRVRFGTLRNVNFQVPPRKHFTYLEDYPRVGYEEGNAALRSAPWAAGSRRGKNLGAWEQASPHCSISMRPVCFLCSHDGPRKEELPELPHLLGPLRSVRGAQVP